MTRETDPPAPDADGPPERFDVPAESAGMRLDLFLAGVLETSRAQARRLLEASRVRVDGRAASARDKGRALVAGAYVEVTGFRAAEDQRIVPEPSDPKAGPIVGVLARGAGWLAVDKRAGAPVHPLVEDETGTVLNAVVSLHPEVQGVGERGLRSGVVHRLDVDTSGVLLVATEQPSWDRLRDAFRSHRVEKVYRAIVAGTLAEALEQEVGLVVAQHKPARVKVVPAPPRDGSVPARGVRLAVQRIRPLEALAGATLVEIQPRTGFLHQIRATLAELGHPVLGDAVYGDVAGAAPRHMLHAAQVRFDEIDASSPDPDDFSRVLSGLRITHH
ncbi:MAG: RluA family pseudouridine synthase [Myxococcota bacterium]|jgi:23S rRNA pseudouridine1911/1915/1917 synthase|nr:RluA family pseudouridine synthase [Myxococcota bacterium]